MFWYWNILIPTNFHCKTVDGLYRNKEKQGKKRKLKEGRNKELKEEK
jgi:hypothetical protein